MTRIKNLTDLKFAISVLEAEQKKDLELLKIQVSDSINGFNPLSLLKNSFKDLNQSDNLYTGIIGNVIGITFRYFTRYILIGNTNNPIKNFIVTILQSSISNLVEKNPAIINFIKKILFSLIKKDAIISKNNEQSK